MLAAEGRDRLRRHRGVAADKGQRGRALEQLCEALLAGPLGGKLGEPVLDDAEAGVCLTQLGAQLGRLGDADAAVIDREDRLGALDLGGDLLDCG